MKKSANWFSFKSGAGSVSGWFNIYQGKDGYIYLQMGDKYTKLSKEQLDKLCINVYILDDFDYSLYKKAYIPRGV